MMSSRNIEREQFWRLVVEEHAKSGLSAREFCRREAISEPSFYSWRRKIRSRDAEAAVGRVVPVEVVNATFPVNDRPDEFALEIVAGDQLVVRVRESCSAETLTNVLTATQQLIAKAASC